MPEILTESFCERCGTRYTFETAAPKAGRFGRFKTLSSGLKNYVLSDDASLDEALAAARNDDDRRASSEQLDAFHKTFNFCMSCRQYTCSNCWNEPEGRCLTCAPNLGREILPAPFPTLEPTVGLIGAAAGNGNGNGHPSDNGSGPVTIDATSWPTVDLGESAAAAAATGLTADPSTEADDSGLVPVSRLEALFGIAPKPRPVEVPDATVTADATVSADAAVSAEATAEPVVDALAVAPTEPVAEPSIDTSDWLSGEPGSDEVLIGDVSTTATPGEVDAEPIAAEAQDTAGGEPIDEALSVEALLAGVAGPESVESTEDEPTTLDDAIAEPVATEEADAAQEIAAAATLSEPEPEVDDSHPIAAAAALAITAEAATADEPAMAEAATADVPEMAETATAADEPEMAGAATADEPEMAETATPAAAIQLVGAIPTVPPTRNATDERAAAAAGNTSTILRRFQASRPAAGLLAPAAVAADASRDDAPAERPAQSEQVVMASPEPAAAPAPLVAPTPEPIVASAIPEAAAPEVPSTPAVPEAPSRPQVDQVGAPVWHMVAPEGAPAPAAASTAPAQTNGHGHEAEPQWPASPGWPAATAPRPAPTGADAIWAQSSRDVLNRPGPAGVQACLNCGLPLSSTARFCRRCGSSQLSA